METTKNYIDLQPETLDEKRLAALEAEGKEEQKQVTTERKRLYQERIDRAKELPKLPKRILLLDCSANGGDFATQYITLADERLDPTNRDAISVAAPGTVLPNLDEYAGIIISGSAATPSEKSDYPWIEPLEKYITGAIEKKIPILGICFGMQLLADLEGREVPENIGGIEQGVWKTTIFASTQSVQNPIFKGLHFQSDSANEYASALIPTLGTHSYSVKKGDLEPHGFSYPSHVFNAEAITPELLANPYHYPMIEIRDGKKVFGIQFHPEYNSLLGVDYQAARVKINARKIQAAGQNPLEILKNLGEYKTELQAGQNQDGSIFLKNFIDICLSEN